jgi:hypothetical protein
VQSRFQRRDQSPGFWFRNDILDILGSIEMANWEVARHVNTPQMRLYRKGFEAAFQAIATAFGLSYAPPAFAESESTPVDMDQQRGSFTLLDGDVLAGWRDDDLGVRVIG